MKVWKDAYKAQEPGALSINLLASLSYLQQSVSLQGQYAYRLRIPCYLPQSTAGELIYTGKGVEIKSGENAKLDYRESNIHYVKIGHQSALEDRFTKYNTHNPSSECILVSRT